MITFDCALCGNPITVPDAYTGRRVKCLRCCKPARVPAESQQARRSVNEARGSATGSGLLTKPAVSVSETPQGRLDWNAVRAMDELPLPLRPHAPEQIRRPRVPTFRWSRLMGGIYTCVGVAMLALCAVVYFIMPDAPRATNATTKVAQSINAIYLAGALISAALFLALGQVLYALRDIARTYRRAR